MRREVAVTRETAERILRNGWRERGDAHLALPMAATICALYDERDAYRATILDLRRELDADCTCEADGLANHRTRACAAAALRREGARAQRFQEYVETGK